MADANARFWKPSIDSVARRSDGLKYVYLPVVETETASRSAMAHVVRTFFGGNPAEAATALLDLPDHKLSEEELKQLSTLIRKAMDQGR